MAAWEGDRCVAQLHCYRVSLPDWRSDDWPEWNRWGPQAAWRAGLGLSGPAWCHACLHVGRTLESDREETRELVLRFARKNDWDCNRTLDELNALPGVSFSKNGMENIMQELRSSGRTAFRTTEPGYYGRGIGTALCEASVRWAREHDYVAALAPGAPGGLFEFAVWSGHLPWTSYARLGFETVAVRGERDGLPGWAQGDSPPEVMAEVRAALATGRPPQEFHERLMLLDLRHHKQC